MTDDGEIIRDKSATTSWLKRVSVKMLGYVIVVVSLLVGLFLAISGLWGFIGPHGSGPTPEGVLLGLVFFAGAVVVVLVGRKVGRRLVGEPSLREGYLADLILGLLLVALSICSIFLKSPESDVPSLIGKLSLGPAILAVVGLAYRFWTAGSRRP